LSVLAPKTVARPGQREAAIDLDAGVRLAGVKAQPVAGRVEHRATPVADGLVRLHKGQQLVALDAADVLEGRADDLELLAHLRVVVEMHPVAAAAALGMGAHRRAAFGARQPQLDDLALQHLALFAHRREHAIAREGPRNEDGAALEGSHAVT
jgi:hypothetical protein